MSDHARPTLGVSRRRFLTTAAGAALSAAVPIATARGAALAGPVAKARRVGRTARYQRFSVTSQEGSEMLASYEQGVAAMMQLPFRDPRNWYRIALVHLLDCPHRNWWFLPWHRGYLGWCERTIRSLSGNPDFTLPFWDWTTTPSVPRPFFGTRLDPAQVQFGYLRTFTDFRTRFAPEFGTFWSALTPDQKQQLAVRSAAGHGDFRSADALWDRIREHYIESGRNVSSGVPELRDDARVIVGPARTAAALQQTTFARFASGRTPNHAALGDARPLEGQQHDSVHDAVGGMMAAWLSPVDPLFFLHHANLDRLWTIWAARQGAAPTVPVGPDQRPLAAWADEPFLFFSDEDGRPAPTTTAGAYATPDVFEYEYGPAWAPAAPPVLAAGPARILKGTIMSSTLELGRAGSARVADGALGTDAAAARPLTAEITIQPPPNARDIRFQVFVNPPQDASSLTPEAPGFAGTIQFFGGTHHMTQPSTFAVPLGPAIDALRAAGALGTADALRLEVIPDTEGIARRSPSARLRGVSVRML